MSFQEAYLAAPPVSRTITAATVLLSVPGHLGLYSLHWVLFLKDYIFTIRQIPQLWRVVTTFFITGPQLGLIFDPFFLWHYSSQLETGAPRFSRPGGYAFYLLFVSSVILLLGGVLVGGFALLSPLTMALMYTFAQEDPNRNIHFFIVDIPAKYLPYASLVITYLLNGPFVTMVQATGIPAAHLYDFLDRIWPQYGGGQEIIRVPGFLQSYFAQSGQSGQARSYGTAFGPRAGGSGGQAVPPTADAARAWTSGSSAWDGRGVGRRLG